MKKITIIHFNAIELYPPVLNLLNNISVDRLKVTVLTTTSYGTSFKQFENIDSGIKIIRLGRSGSGVMFLLRWINFIYFYFSTLLYLIFTWPSKVLYFETLSSFSPLIYKKLFNKKLELYIHYHEYTSFKEYQSGSKLLKYFHAMERKIFTKAKWISHINDQRLHQFKQDNSSDKLYNTKVLPNYPPLVWSALPTDNIVKWPVRLVYVGSLGLDLMYTESFAHWVKSKEQTVVWDIYTANLKPEVATFFKNLSAKNIHIKGHVDYYNLPNTLKQYDVGIILYKGEIPNHLYVTPNKLFEYHSCGLDVWFPDKLVSCLPLRTQYTYPKICSLDFEHLSEVDINQLVDREGCQLLKQKYSCEEVLQHLINELEK